MTKDEVRVEIRRGHMGKGVSPRDTNEDGKDSTKYVTRMNNESERSGYHPESPPPKKQHDRDGVIIRQRHKDLGTLPKESPGRGGGRIPCKNIRPISYERTGKGSVFPTDSGKYNKISLWTPTHKTFFVFK